MHGARRHAGEAGRVVVLPRHARRRAGDGEDAKKLWKEVVDTDMMAFFEYDMAQMFLRVGTAPARPLLKSKGTYKPPVHTAAARRQHLARATTAAQGRRAPRPRS